MSGTRIELIKTRVNAKSRKLKADWSIETMDRFTNTLEEMRELMGTVGIQGFQLYPSESNIVLDLMFSNTGSAQYPRYDVQRLIDNQLLNYRDFQDDPYGDSGIVMVTVTDLLEQEFQLLENYRNL